MSLKDKYIKNEYRSLLDNVVQDFYIPLLKEAVSYKRAVGFFSSSSLVELTKGIASMAERGGKIQILLTCQMKMSMQLKRDMQHERK